MKDHFGLLGSLGSLIVKSGYKNNETIKKLKAPTLILHGENDEVISAQHSKELYGKAGLNRAYRLQG